MRLWSPAIQRALAVCVLVSASVASTMFAMRYADRAARAEQAVAPLVAVCAQEGPARRQLLAIASDACARVDRVELPTSVEAPPVDFGYLQDAEIQDPEIQDPEVDDPEVQEPEVDDPEVQDPEIDDPDTSSGCLPGEVREPTEFADSRLGSRCVAPGSPPADPSPSPEGVPPPAESEPGPPSEPIPEDPSGASDGFGVFPFVFDMGMFVSGQWRARLVEQARVALATDLEYAVDLVRQQEDPPRRTPPEDGSRVVWGSPPLFREPPSERR